MESLESRRMMSAVPLSLPAVTVGQSFDAPVAEIGGLPGGAAAPVAAIRWGDGRVSVVRSTALVGNTGKFVAWTPHTYSGAGTFNATVVFRDRTGKVLGRVREQVTVWKQPVTPSASAPPGTTFLSGDQTGVTAAVTGTQFQGVLGTISFPVTPPDSELSYIGVRIDWGDGAMSKGELTRVGPDQFQVTGAHVYATPGKYTVHVAANYGGRPLMPIPGQPEIMVADVLGAFAAMDATLDVSGALLTLPPPAVQITAQTLPTAYADTFTGTVATMTGISPDPLGTDVYAVVNWGDGNSGGTAGIFAQYENGQYVIAGNRPFLSPNNHGLTPVWGKYDLTVTLYLNDHADPTKNTVLGSVTNRVTVLPNTPKGVTLNLRAGRTFSGSLGVVDLDPTRPLQVPAIDWGDGTPPDTQVTLTPIGNNEFNVTASHTYATSGEYRISLSGNYAGPPLQLVTVGGPGLLVSTALVS